MTPNRLAVTILVGLLAAIGGWLVYQRLALPGASHSADVRRGNQPAVDAVVAGSVPVALGWLEPAAGLIEINGPPGDRLHSVLYAEGDRVEQNKVLATLESRTQCELEVESIQCQLDEAAARLQAETMLADSRIEIAALRLREIGLQNHDARQLQHRVGLLQQNHEWAQRQLARLQSLRQPNAQVGLSDPLVSDQELEGQQLVVDQAATELAAARGDLEKLRATHGLAEAMAKAELSAAKASKQQVLAAIPTASLRQRLKLARARLAETAIQAPASGTILRVLMQPGESISDRPILQMADLQQMVAIAEVYETDVKQLRLQQPAIVTSPAFKPPHDGQRGLHGRVVQIGQIVSTPQLKSLNPFVRADRHVVLVRIQLDDSSSRHAADFVNLQVSVRFLGDPRQQPR